MPMMVSFDNSKFDQGSEFIGVPFDNSKFDQGSEFIVQEISYTSTTVI